MIRRILIVVPAVVLLMFSVIAFLLDYRALRLTLLGALVPYCGMCVACLIAWSTEAVRTNRHRVDALFGTWAENLSYQAVTLSVRNSLRSSSLAFVATIVGMFLLSRQWQPKAEVIQINSARSVKFYADPFDTTTLRTVQALASAGDIRPVQWSQNGRYHAMIVVQESPPQYSFAFEGDRCMHGREAGCYDVDLVTPALMRVRTPPRPPELPRDSIGHRHISLVVARTTSGWLFAPAAARLPDNARDHKSNIDTVVPIAPARMLRQVGVDSTQLRAVVQPADTLLRHFHQSVEITIPNVARPLFYIGPLVTPVGKGYLLREVSFRVLGADSAGEINAALTDRSWLYGTLCTPRCADLHVHIRALPRRSFFEAQEPRAAPEIHEYASLGESVDWDAQDPRQSVTFSFVRPPYQWLRPVLDPFLPVASLPDLAHVILGIILGAATVAGLLKPLGKLFPSKKRPTT
jgi:hypothetical protein